MKGFRRETDPLPGARDQSWVLRRPMQLVRGAGTTGAHIVTRVRRAGPRFFDGPVAEWELSSNEMLKRVPLGELLVNAGLVHPADLEAALQEQLGSELRLGVILARRGLVGETQVTQILSRQLSVPWVSLHHIAFAPELLGRVPSTLAREHRVVPVYVRRVRRVGEILYLAMEDPEDEIALTQVEQFAGGLQVKPMIASPSDITRTLVEHYGLEPSKVDAAPMNHRAPSKRRETAVLDRPSLALQVQLTLADGRTVHVPIVAIGDPYATLLDALQSSQVISDWCFSGSA